VWHEYVHYLQNIATTIGIRIFLNWIAVLTQFSAAVERKTPLPVPMYMDTSNPFPREFNRLIDEMGKLMGSSQPLDTSPPPDVQAFTPYIDPKDGSHALLCIEESGQRIGIPLAGNAFVEGMAQGAQWIIEGHGKWDGGLKNAIGRVETSWRPATPDEGFEIVRRRLFQPIEADLFAARDASIRAFMDLYGSQHQEFPPECREMDYERRFKTANPRHRPKRSRR
jgi:hypothetical protein